MVSEMMIFIFEKKSILSILRVGENDTVLRIYIFVLCKAVATNLRCELAIYFVL